MTFRPLTTAEIAALESDGCRCPDWSKITVAETFTTGTCVRTRFEGDCRLGPLSGSVVSAEGFRLPAGIYDATLRDCTVGADTRIARVSGLIERTDIGSGVCIDGAGSIGVSGDTSGFGAGVRVNVLDETGGRRVTIYPGLTAQTAYLATFYRHDPKLTTALTSMMEARAAQHRATRVTIADGVRISNLGSAVNVSFMEGAKVEGAGRLREGTVGPAAKIGPGAVLEEFILEAEAEAGAGVNACRVFLGQAASLDCGYVAHDSLIFANSRLACGECASIFAGPHTVSMHRSTLLIGGYFSFFNAGSATNQSNHHYRIGPVHQGVMERGCKTTSENYILWPARFGLFTLVGGRHYGHPDTSMLPYSYAFDEGGDTVVIPAANIKTSGTLRDIMKWADRDARSERYGRLDLINYNALNPQEVTRMYRGILFLARCEADPATPLAHHFTLRTSHIRRGRELYALTIDFFTGQAIVERVLGAQVLTRENFHTLFTSPYPDMVADWVDLAGMVTPRAAIEELCSRVARGEIDDSVRLDGALAELHSRYDDFTWGFIIRNFRRCYGIAPESVTVADIKAIIARWSESVIALNSMRKEDALKDFASSPQPGFGIDGDAATAEADFKAVRGLPESDHRVFHTLAHYDRLLNRGFEAIHRLNSI